LYHWTNRNALCGIVWTFATCTTRVSMTMRRSMLAQIQRTERDNRDCIPGNTTTVRCIRLGGGSVSTHD